MQIILYILTGIVAWLGLRHLISIIIGQSHGGQLRPGQWLCHFTSLVLLWGGCVAAIYLHYFWLLIVVVAVEYGFRKVVVRSGKQMSFRDKLKIITDIEPSLRMCICTELLPQYETGEGMDPDLAMILAAQVCNHLMGDDFAKNYDNLSSEIQKKTDTIKGLVGAKVAEVMTENKAIRELIIRHIMTTHVVYHCLFDGTWFDKPEMKNREKLIHDYGSDGNEFPDVYDFDRYVACAFDFVDARKHNLPPDMPSSKNFD